MRSLSWREPSSPSSLRSVQALATHRFLFRFAFAGANVFGWVFVFQYFYLIEPDIAHGLARTALLYALSQTVTCLVTPFAAGLLRKGARKMLVAASLFGAASFVFLGATFVGLWGSVYTPFALATFAIGLGIYRACYWVPYEIEAQATGKRRVSLLAEYCIALAPLLAGLFIVALPLGSMWLLFAAAGFIAISIVPILFLRDVHEGFSWGYRESFAQLVEPANRDVVRHALLEGISGAALLLFWPLAIFLITEWSYGMLGVVLSLTFIISILTRSLVRTGLRKAGVHTSRPLQVVFAVTPWLFRPFVGTPLGAIFVDTYFHTTTPRRISMDPLAFEQAADAGSFVDEYTALKEMALSLGRIAVAVVGAVAALTLSLPAAFIVVFLCAALCSGILAFR